MDRLKIAVVGAGAVGGLLAWRLAQAGHAVSIIARGEHLRAIQASGLRLIEGADETIGERGVPNRIAIAATADPGDSTTTGGVQDLVVTGLKAHALPAVLSALGPMLGPATRVIPALNGVPFWYVDGPATLRTVDPAGLAAISLAPGRVIGCVVHLAAEVVAPGVIRHTGGRRLIFGEALAGADLPTDARWSVHQVGETFRSAGFAAEHSSDIRRDVWTKLIGNLSFNPVAAITGLRMDALCADPEICALLRLLIDEGKAVAAALGVPLQIDADARIEMARGLGGARISTLQDFEAHRQPELGALVGAVIELADRHGVSVPMLRQVYTLAVARARALGLPGY